MTFEALVDQTLDMVRRRGRMSYRMLKRHFELRDEMLEDLKEELLYSHPEVVDEEGRGLVWTGDPAPPEPGMRHGAESESRFHALLRAVMWLLQRERRVTYRELKHVYGLDEALLEEIREELRLRRLAIDEQGKILVWTGEAHPAIQPASATTSPSALPEVTTGTSSAIPEPAPCTTTTDTPHEEPTTAPEPLRRAPEAERRQLTVMFCDLADSTTLSQQLDPEDLREVIRAYQATAAEVIHQYEGHMAQYLGDGLLIYFGWPKAHEDDAERALHASLGIVEALTTTLNPRLGREKGVQLAVRIGIHTGPVVVGEMGGSGRQENLATGTTVNIASRLEGLAMPNAVVISHVTARLVRDTFVLEDLGTHPLKGVVAPMQVFRIRGPLEAREDETVAVGVPFLVGRDEEMGLLRRRWEQVKEGRGQVVLISGTAGLGKSSLVEVLRTHVRHEGLPRLAFRCSSYHRNSALYPVMTHVGRLLDLQREDTAQEKLAKLEQRLRTTSLPLEEVVPLVAALLAVPLDGRYPAQTLTPPQQKQQTLDALVAWMLEEAERQPVLVAWEDLHWADPSTLELLGLILEQTPTVPMLHVLTFRPEFEVPWPTRSHMTPITLNRLERPQVEALITHLAGGKVLPAEVVQHIVGKTDGVPLYVEELTKMLLESDHLREEAEQYVLTGPLRTVAIPDTLQDALMARLDQLNTAKEVAQLGAVLGREFSYELIQAIWLQEDKTLQAGLTQLVDAELLYQRGRLPRARYHFKHALIQDAAYQSLLKSTRQQYHQRIARVLAEQFPETTATQPELLAHHYTETGLPERAMHYWQVAGERAMQHSAIVEAIAHLTKGLEVLSTLPETPERTRQELRLQTALGPALMVTRGVAAPEVAQSYRRIQALAQQVEETPHGLWLFYYMRGEIETAHAFGAQLLDFAQRQHDLALLFEAHMVLGLTLFRLGEVLPARVHLEQAIALYDPTQHHAQAFLYATDPGVMLLCYVARDLWLLGYPAQALERSQAALTLAHELSHPFSLAYAQTWTAFLQQLRRDRHAVQAQAEAVIRFSTAQGFPFLAEAGIFLQGWALTEQGQGDEGIARMSQALAGPRAVGVDQGLPYWLALLAEAYGKGAQTEEGLALLSEALGVAHKAGGRYWEAELYRLKGVLLLHQHPPDETQAETWLSQALEVARRQQVKSWELRAALSLARLWREQGKREAARQLLTEVYSWFTEGFETADLQEAHAVLEGLGSKEA